MLILNSSYFVGTGASYCMVEWTTNNASDSIGKWPVLSQPGSTKEIIHLKWTINHATLDSQGNNF